MIILKNIKKIFHQHLVLKDINLSFESGYIYGVLGNNGVGKTRLTKIIFQEYSQTSGEIKVTEENLKYKDLRSWYFFPENNELSKNIKVCTYLEITRQLTGLSKEIFKKRSAEVIKFIDIEKFFRHKTGSLSAGQQKLVSLFLCFILKPKVIFLWAYS